MNFLELRNPARPLKWFFRFVNFFPPVISSFYRPDQLEKERERMFRISNTFVAILQRLEFYRSIKLKEEIDRGGRFFFPRRENKLDFKFSSFLLKLLPLLFRIIYTIRPRTIMMAMRWATSFSGILGVPSVRPVERKIRYSNLKADDRSLSHSSFEWCYVLLTTDGRWNP